MPIVLLIHIISLWPFSKKYFRGKIGENLSATANIIADLGLPDNARLFLERLFSSLNNHCSSYIDELHTGKCEPSAKIVQDSLWGFLRYSPAEIVLIDSPLFQRLRYIRQLGFAYLLFPNAGYSRFEHSLGVCHVIGEYIRVLKDSQSHGTGEQTIEISNDDIQILRLAALLHDIGHIAFSHVSDRSWHYFETKKEIDLIRSAFKRKYKCREEPSHAEVLSACITLSPTVAQLLDIGIATGHLKGDVRVIADRICEYLLGGAREPKRWFLSEMLNSDMDADKLDYIQRDCMVTGVPLPFDVKRLILKTRLLSGSHPRGRYVRLAISLGGARALLDLTVSRMMLREKIYRHPKILAAEAMFENTLQLASELNPTFLNPMSLLTMDDESMLRMFESYNELFPPSDNSVALGKGLFIQALASALRQRKLIKRAFVLSSHFLADGITEASKAKFMLLMTNSSLKQSFKDAIFKELQNILTLLNKSQLCPDGTHWIAVASVDLKGGAASQLFPPRIIGASGEEITDSEMKAQIFYQTEWANAYESSGALHYVFCPEHVRTYCYIAVRNVLARDHNLFFKKSSSLLAKINDDDIHVVEQSILSRLQEEQHSQYVDLRRACSIAGGSTYEEKLIAAESDISPKTFAIIDEFNDKVSKKLEEVSSYRGTGHHRMSNRRLSVWISQFPEQFQRDALRLFLNITYLDRDAFVNALSGALSCLPTNVSHSVYMAPLTSSGDLLNYYAGDLHVKPPVRTFVTVTKALEAILANQGSSSQVLTIVDDVLGTGKQSSDVFRIWHGEPPDSEDPSISDTLSNDAIECLRNDQLSIFFVFGFALREGKERLIQELAARGIKANVFAHAESSIADGVFGANKTSAAPVHHGEFRDYCIYVGKQLLKERSDRKEWSAAKLEKRALGYSGASQLVTTSYNCPTITLPIIWADGTVDGKSWTPLFRRRFREKH